MIFDNSRISARQMQALLILWIFSTALIALPSLSGGLYAMLAGGVIIVAECGLISFAVKRMGMLMRKISAVLAGVSMIFYTGMNIRLLCSAVGLYLLPDTPSRITAAVFVIAAVYAAFLGIQTIGRAGEIIFVIAAVNAVIAAVLCLFDEGREIVGAVGQGQCCVSNGLQSAFLFGGGQALFVLLPRTDGEKIGSKAVSAAVIAVLAAALFAWIALVKFGAADTAARAFPALNILDTVSLEFIFGDKQDVFMLRLWILAVFSAVGLGIFAFGNIFGENGAYSAVGGAMAFAMSFVPKTAEEALWLIYMAGAICLVLFGALLPLIGILFRKAGGEK